MCAFVDQQIIYESDVSASTSMDRFERQPRKNIGNASDQASETKPVGAFIIDAESLKIIFANQYAMMSLVTIAHRLPCKPDVIVGEDLAVLFPNFGKEHPLWRDITSGQQKQVFLRFGKTQITANIAPVSFDTGMHPTFAITWRIVTAPVSQKSTLLSVSERRA
jgi:hypothetical protein